MSTAPTNLDISSTTKEQHHVNTNRDSPRPLSTSVKASDATQPVASRSHPLRADINDDSNVSEAETDILSEAAAGVKRNRKKISLENGGTERRGRDGEEKKRDNGNGAESPRKKRRRRSRSASESSGSEADDTTFPSDLSSALSSRHTSPSHVRRRMLNEAKQLAITKKRKVRADSSSSEDDRPAPQHKLRRRRGSAAVVENSGHLRKPSNTSVGLSPLRSFSPSRNNRPKPHKQRQRPPPLHTTREKNSDEESDSSSSTSSRLGSSARKRRPRSTVPTPGSPVNMSHRPKRDTAGRTHLHRACQRGNVADVEQILEQGTELIHVDDHAGYLPIHEASLNGHVDVVRVLVKHGSPFDKRSTVEQETPLLDAVENGHIDVVKYLLELGANPRKRDKQGRTCLDANKEAWDRDGPEDCRPELDDILKAAISKQRASRPSDDETNRASAAPDRDSHSSRDPSVASPVHQSPSAPSVAPVQTIRRRNARAEQSRKDLLWLDSGKGSVIKLREKAREGDAQMVHALLETGLKPDTEALIGAIKGGHTELVSLMLAYSADADPVPGQNERESGRRKREVSMPVGEETPMLAAIGRGNVAILKYLLDNGVDPRRLDNRGKSYSDIAREREGEFWQDEVQLLKQAWIKAGGGPSKRSTDKSPQRLKTTSPKTAIKHSRRSSSTSSRAQSRPPVKTKEEKAANRALSVNHLDDSAVVSDRESTAEPLGPPPKNRSGSPRRRRRLVSGKVRAQEEAMAKGVDTPRSVDGDKKPVRNPEKDKVSTKAPKSDMEDTIRVDQRSSKKPKSEPPDDTKMEDAPPLDRRKLKLEREKERERDRLKPSPAESRQTKRSASNRDRSRSPPRAPRSETEKRQELEQLRRRRRDDHPDDRGSRRRESVTEPDPRKARDDRRQRVEGRRGSVSSEPSRRRDDSSRPPKRDSSVTNSRPIEDDRRRRIREKEGDKAESDRDSKSVGSTEGEKDRAKDVKERKPKEKRKDNDTSNREDGETSKEVVRRRYLCKELALIQKNAAKESKKAREDEVIIRELALRKLREDEERKMREQEKAAEEREAREAKEAAEKAAEEAEERERLAQEAADREAHEKEEAERLANEKLEAERKEREVREREEQERKEREAREAEERRIQEEERRKEHERQRQEQERLRLEMEEKERKLAAEREELRLKEEAEKERLERERLEKERIAEEEERNRKAAEEEQKRKEIEKEKAEKEARDRKVAEELQQQIAHEQEVRRREQEESAAKEKARISVFPTSLRIFAEREAAGLPPLGASQYIPLFVASFCGFSPNSERPVTPNGISQFPEFWVSNVQVALVLGTSDLSLSAYPQLGRRPATEHERFRMWSVLKPLLCENISLNSDRSLQERAVSQRTDRDLFCDLQPVFWVKLSDLMPILSPCALPVHTVQFTLDIPTGGKGSPLSRSRSIKRRSETPDGTPVPKSRAPTTNGPITTPTTTTDALVYSTTMPPPGFV